MKTRLLRVSASAVVATVFSGCFTTITGPDGGVVAAEAGPRRAGVVVDPPGPASVAVGTVAPPRRRTVYVEPAPVVVRERPVVVAPPPTVVVIPRSTPRVVYRGKPAYYWNGNYYRRSRGGYVIIR
jgi:hypothetical protein